MFNRAFLIGNLTRDPELRYTPSGIPVARFAIAVNRPKAKSAGGANSSDAASQDVDFINIIAWRRLAEICGEFLKKGRPVAIVGRLQVRPYVKNGVERTMSEVVADSMQMLGRRPDEADKLMPKAAEEASAGDFTPGGQDEVPF